MKIYIFALITLGIAITLVYSCKKENPISNHDQVIEYTPRALNIWHKLSSFNQKLNNNSSRDNVLIPADSVIWYLESMLNIQLSVDTSFCNSYKHKNNYSANIDENGYVTMNELALLFNQMVDDVEYQLNQIESDYKYLIIADLYEENSRSSNLEIGLDGIYATTRFKSYTPFTDDDDWYYGNMLGKADGSYIGISDGGQQLKLRLNNQGIKPTFQYNLWLDPQQTINLDATNTQNRVWAKTATSAPIISDTDMLLYLQNMHYLIYNSESETPYGYFLNSYGSEIYFKLIHFWTSAEPNTSGNYYHKMNIVYGEPVFIPEIE